MSSRRRWTRTVLLSGALALVPVLSSCASTVDSVNPHDYISNPSDGWYRIQEAHRVSNAPIAEPYPESCKSPPSRMGAPEGC